jgi:hypothetical protein
MSIGVIAIWASLAGAKWMGEAIPKMHAEPPEAASNPELTEGALCQLQLTINRMGSR